MNDDNVIIRDFNTENRDDIPIPVNIFYIIFILLLCKDVILIIELSSCQPQVEAAISKVVEKQGSDEVCIRGGAGV